MNQQTADYLAALSKWYADEIKRVIGPSASSTTGPHGPPPPPPPPPEPEDGG